MTQMLTPSSNGKVRKSLASQLDRFDGVLDGLADAIPQVVADTVRSVTAQVVRDAVQAAVSEVLANPDILEKLRNASAPPVVQATAWIDATSAESAVSVPDSPSIGQRIAKGWGRVRGFLAGLRDGCATKVERMGTAVANTWSGMINAIGAVLAPLAVLPRIARYLEFAFAIGVLASLVALFCGPWVASALSGVGAFGSTLALQIGLWVRRMMTVRDGDTTLA